jgi:hypothetical protein
MAMTRRFPARPVEPLPGTSSKRVIMNELESYARRKGCAVTFELEAILDGYIQACLDLIERRKP